MPLLTNYSLKQLTLFLFLTLLAIKSNAQANPTNLEFSPLEAIDTLKTFNKKAYEEDIQALNKDLFFIKAFKNAAGLFLVKKIQHNWIVFDLTAAIGREPEGDVAIKGNFITFTTFFGGAARQTTYSNSDLVLVNFVELSYLAITVQSEYEAWTEPDQRPKESDEAYEKRREKEIKTTKSTCTSNVNFDGSYMRVSRTYKDNCKDCVICLDPGTYKFVKNKFIKLVRQKR